MSDGKKLSSDLGLARIQVMRQGNLANQMIQYLVAKRIQALVPGSVISGVDLPLWRISSTFPYIPTSSNEEYNWHVIPINDVAQKLNEAKIQAVVLSGYFQRLENLPTLQICREIFPDNLCDVEGFGERHLVINIRADEILSGTWHNYTLVPIDYYREIIARTGLQPIFMGQVNEGPYRIYLETHFPNARFLPSQGVMEDFQIIRRSANIVLSVSTFSWLAAWLSHARNIFMPLTGFYNPFQDRDVQLAPLDDKRYVFDLFPINYAVPFELLHLSHDAIGRSWRLTTSDMLGCMLAQWPRFGQVPPQAYEATFDEVFYLGEYADVAAAVANGELRSGFEHFVFHGFREGREPFRSDWRWYSRAYPDAASEVGRGDFATLRDQYVTVGHARGGVPSPSPQAGH